MIYTTTPLNIAVIGASGAIGSSFVRQLSERSANHRIFAFSRSETDFGLDNVFSHHLDLQNEMSIENSAAFATEHDLLDLVIVATGILHEDSFKPEKSLSDMSPEKFQKLFEINTIAPAMIARHFLPRLKKDRRSVFALLSARVGSITDNYLGGWYSYRSSKAALNMIMKSASVEMCRRNKNAVLVSLHPGTVDSDLSKPFQGRVPENNLFTPDYSVSRMLKVIDKLTPGDTGKFFAWDGQEIPF